MIGGLDRRSKTGEKEGGRAGRVSQFPATRQRSVRFRDIGESKPFSGVTLRRWRTNCCSPRWACPWTRASRGNCSPPIRPRTRSNTRDRPLAERRRTATTRRSAIPTRQASGTRSVVTRISVGRPRGNRLGTSGAITIRHPCQGTDVWANWASWASWTRSWNGVWTKVGTRGFRRGRRCAQRVARVSYTCRCPAPNNKRFNRERSRYGCSGSTWGRSTTRWRQEITTTIEWKGISRLRLQRHWRRTITLIAVWRARRKIDAFLVLIKDAWRFTQKRPTSRLIYVDTLARNRSRARGPAADGALVDPTNWQGIVDPTRAWNLIPAKCARKGSRAAIIWPNIAKCIGKTRIRYFTEVEVCVEGRWIRFYLRRFSQFFSFVIDKDDFETIRGGRKLSFQISRIGNLVIFLRWEDLIAKRNCTSFLTRERSMENNFHIEILHVNIFF